MTNQNNQVDWNIIELEIIRFFNATPTYRNVEEWINFITGLIHQETTKAVDNRTEEIRDDLIKLIKKKKLHLGYKNNIIELIDELLSNNK